MPDAPKSTANLFAGAPPICLEVLNAIPRDLTGTELVIQGYEKYASLLDTSKTKARSKSGTMFELLVALALLRHGIGPVYLQASVLNVFDAKFDIFLYHEKFPVVISCKTSLRERWKQASYEGAFFQHVNLLGKSVLLTLSDEGHNVQSKIKNGEVLGLDECMVISRNDKRFDEFLDELAKTDFKKAGKVMPVKAGKTIDHLEFGENKK